MASLLKSRKFWLMIADLVFSISVYFVAKYVNPLAAEDVLWLIGLLQPVVISLITGIAIEDAAIKGALGDQSVIDYVEPE
jgi:hypothetical protein